MDGYELLVNEPGRFRPADFGCLAILVFVGALVVLGVALASERWWLAVVAGVAAVAAVAGAYLLFELLPRRAFERLEAARAGYTREDFFQHFEGMGLRPEAVERAWETLQVWLPWPGFPMRPDDELERQLGIAVHEEIDEILQGCLCREPRDDEWEQANALRTVEDFVVLVDRLYVGSPQEWEFWRPPAWSWRARAIVLLVYTLLLILPALAMFGFGLWLYRHEDRMVFAATAAIGLAIATVVILAMRATLGQRHQT